MYGVTDVISVVCSVLSLLVAIVIGGFQIFQNHRVNKMARQRREEMDDIEARKFLSEYNSTIALLPLCAIAVSYNKNRPYVRKMYSDFRLLSKSVRLLIFEYCGWTMCDCEDGNFFEDCMQALNLATDRDLLQDQFLKMFYDNAKYVRNAITQYAHTDISNTLYKHTKNISSIIDRSFENDLDMSAFETIMFEYDFGNCSEDIACQIACVTAECIAIRSGERLKKFKHFNDGCDYGAPGGWGADKIDTMEDLFLLTLFEIWSGLMTTESEDT